MTPEQEQKIDELTARVNDLINIVYTMEKRITQNVNRQLQNLQGAPERMPKALKHTFTPINPKSDS